jgi:hypothetical protein
MPSKKSKTYALPPKAPPPSRGVGFAWDVKLFPDGKPGFSGPPGVGFPLPAATPPVDKPILSTSPPADFQEWVDHYTRVVGFYVSRLNGLQFNLDEEKAAGPPNTILRFMSEELDKFAGQLHIGDAAISGDYPPNPKLLVWPLNNTYDFRFHFKFTKNGTNFDFWVHLFLHAECDPESLMCTNCLVKVRITDEPTLLDAVAKRFSTAVATGSSVAAGQNPDYISSSSSYLATSSSSYP